MSKMQCACGWHIPAVGIGVPPEMSHMKYTLVLLCPDCGATMACESTQNMGSFTGTDADASKFLQKHHAKGLS